MIEVYIIIGLLITAMVVVTCLCLIDIARAIREQTEYFKQQDEVS